MKRLYFFIILLLSGAHLLHAQTSKDTIGSYKNWQSATILTYQGKKLKTMHKINQVVRTDPEAYKYMIKAKKAYAYEISILSVALAGELTYDIISSPAHHNNYNSAIPVAICLAGLGAAIPLTITVKRNIWRAVRKYNSDIQKTSYIERQPQLYFTTTGANVGVGLRF